LIIGIDAAFKSGQVNALQMAAQEIQAALNHVLSSHTDVQLCAFVPSRDMVCNPHPATPGKLYCTKHQAAIAKRLKRKRDDDSPQAQPAPPKQHLPPTKRQCVDLPPRAQSATPTKRRHVDLPPRAQSATPKKQRPPSRGRSPTVKPTIQQRCPAVPVIPFVVPVLQSPMTSLSNQFQITQIQP